MVKIDWTKWKRRVAVFKFTLSRGYIFCQLPALSIIGAGVLAPYFPEWHLYTLAAIALATFIFIGWLDVKFNILQEEQKYMTEKNPILMEGLFNKGSVGGVTVETVVKEQKAQELIDEVTEDEQ